MTAEDKLKDKNDKRHQKNWDLPEDVFQKFKMAFEERLKQDKNAKEKDLAAELLRTALDGRRTSNKTREIPPTMKRIQNKYANTRCDDCGNLIPVSVDFWWAPGMSICMECHIANSIKGFSDKTLSKRYTLIRELTQTINGLKKAANELSDKNSEMQRKINVYELLQNLYKAATEHHNKLPALEASLKNFMRSDASKPEEQKHILEEVLRAIQQDAASDKTVLDAINELRAFLTHPFLRKKKAVQQTEPGSEEVPA